MAVFVFYRIPLDFLQKEWMYRGVMLRIMSPGRVCFDGGGYRFPTCWLGAAGPGCLVALLPQTQSGLTPIWLGLGGAARQMGFPRLGAAPPGGGGGPPPPHPTPWGWGVRCV